MDSVVPGCLEISLKVVFIDQQKIFPLTKQQEEFLTDLGVIKVTARGYQYPPHPEDDHKDDKPDDKPSDSGFDTLTTITSELTELKEVLNVHNVNKIGMIVLLYLTGYG